MVLNKYIVFEVNRGGGGGGHSSSQEIEEGFIPAVLMTLVMLQGLLSFLS